MDMLDFETKLIFLVKVSFSFTSWDTLFFIGLCFQLILYVEYLVGLLEATLSPVRLPKPLKTLTLLMGLSVPFLISSGMFIRMAGTIIGIAVRFDR